MRVKPLEEMLSEPEESIDYIIHPGLLCSGGIMVLSGDPGVGKSFLAQQLTFEIASGKRVLRLFPCRQQRVVYVEFEVRNTLSRARFKQKSWIDAYPDAVGNIGYFDEKIIRLDSTSKTNAKEFETMLINYGAQTVIVDSFAYTVWDETDLAALKTALEVFRGIAQKLGIAFIIIHHLIKRGTTYDQKESKWKEPPLKLDNLRGSKFLGYEIDTALGVVRAKVKPRSIGFLKHRFSPVPYNELEPLEFKFQAGTPVPFRCPDLLADTLENADAGITTFTDLETIMKITRPTMIKTADRLEELGLIKVIKGGGKGVGTYIELPI